MRSVIATAAFLVPLLIMIAIGSTCSASGRAVTTQLGAAQLGELRDFVAAQDELLNRYASQPGEAESGGMPHLALDRFDRRGCDAHGQPWYRLALDRTVVPCGVLRRAAPHLAPTVCDGRTPTLVLPLTGRWSYWEITRPTPAPAKSP